MIDPVTHYSLVTPRKLAVHDLETGRKFSYLELDSVINKCAHAIVEHVGPRSGKRIAVLAKNCAEILFLKLACVRAGTIFVPLNWRLSDTELGVIFENCDPDIFLTDLDRCPKGYDGPSQSLTQFVEKALEKNDKVCPNEWRREWNDTTLLLYTSGTSGTPKGVQLSEENTFWSGTNFIHGYDVGADSVFLCDMPMFHTAGLIAAARTPLLAGGTVLVSDGFDPARTLSRMSNPDYGITNYFSVPQMAQMMWNEPNFKPEMLSGLSAYTTGGAPNPKVLKERFLNADIMLSDGFGMTETGSNFGMPIHSKEVILSKTGSCGVAHIAIQTRIVDEDGNEVPRGESGELWVRGPSVTSGYFRNPTATAAAFEDGWFKTGDVAVQDEDGFFYLVDRKKDMFISGGENVYPAEVEAAILRMPSIAEIAVIGVPDERWGEVGCACFSWVPGKAQKEDDIKAHCVEALAKYKVPKHYMEIADIPKTGSGKVKKHELKKIWETKSAH